jgi:hypothetical protein
MEAMQIQAKRNFVSKMVAFVQEKFPLNYAQLTKDELREKVEELIKLAEINLLFTRYQIKLFIAYNCYYKWEGVITDENIKAVFSSREYSAKEKFELVREIVSSKK